MCKISKQQLIKQSVKNRCRQKKMERRNESTKFVIGCLPVFKHVLYKYKNSKISELKITLMQSFAKILKKRFLCAYFM